MAPVDRARLPGELMLAATSLPNPRRRSLGRPWIHGKSLWGQLPQSDGSLSLSHKDVGGKARGEVQDGKGGAGDSKADDEQQAAENIELIHPRTEGGMTGVVGARRLRGSVAGEDAVQNGDCFLQMVPDLGRSQVGRHRSEPSGGLKSKSLQCRQ